VILNKEADKTLQQSHIKYI